MTIKEFNYYIENQLVKKKSIDPQEARSLFKQAKARLNFIKAHKITEENCGFLFEDIYEVIRESTQALMSLKGFKPYSHEAVISFLKEYYSRNFSNEEFGNFNHYRVMRNNMVYKGKRVVKVETKEALRFAKDFIKKVESLYEKKIIK